MAFFSRIGPGPFLKGREDIEVGLSEVLFFYSIIINGTDALATVNCSVHKFVQLSKISPPNFDTCRKGKRVKGSADNYSI